MNGIHDVGGMQGFGAAVWRFIDGIDRDSAALLAGIYKEI